MLRRRMVITTVLLVLFSLVGRSMATTYYVTPDGNDLDVGTSWATAFATIQTGLDIAADDDVIDVNVGTYYETVDFNTVSCTLRSTDPNNWDIVADTIIDANGANYAVTSTGSGGEPVLKGFTITGAVSTGVSFGSCTPTVTNCIIEDNQTGLNCVGGLIENCIIRDNNSIGIDNYGGGNPTIRNNMIHNNDKGINTGMSSYADINNCTIVNNTTAGIYALWDSLNITNCILWENNDDLYSCTATYSCIQDNDSGTGNIVGDANFPYFEDYDSNDFHLTLVSPCINTGDPNFTGSNETDIDGDERVMHARVDMGADEAFNVHNITQNTHYQTIQNALDNANASDVIMLSPGTYYETVDFETVSCTLTGTNPNDWDVVASTVIDANGATNAVKSTGSGGEPVLNGFTITGAVSGGVSFGSCTPTVTNCIIEDNQTGVLCVGGLIENCIVRDNNSIGISTSSSPTIKNCFIYNNDKGIDFMYSVIDISGCTIVNNTTSGISAIWGGSANIINCILWENNDDLVSCTATYSCIQDGDAGTGNISSYPYFEDYSNDDFHLSWNSPCINRGDPNFADSNETDIDGEGRVAEEEYVDVRVDMGADEINTHNINLVQNPGFEDGDVGGVPVNWTDQWVSVSKSIDSNDFHSGNYSWKFENDGSTYSGANSYFISINPNSLYKLSAWIKCENGNEDVSLGWAEFDANKDSIEYLYMVLNHKTVPTEWTKFERFYKTENSGAAYVKLQFFGPYGKTGDPNSWPVGTVWWDDFSLVEYGNEYLPAYGCVNEPNVAETVNFGNGLNEDLVSGTITSYMSASSTDSNDNNITYRELKAGYTVTVEFPAFNVPDSYDSNDPNDPNSFPLTPMLLEIMYKDTVDDCTTTHLASYGDLVIVKSKIDYIDIDPSYLISEQDYRLVHLGGSDNGQWKYMQYGFQVSDYQLLRAIGGNFTIKIINYNDVNLPIDYISLRKITQGEYDDLTNKQRSFRGFYEVEIPADNPDSPSYDDPNLVVFSRDTMRTVYKHTKPDVNEPNSITAFGCWGEVEPMSFSIYSENGVNDLSISVSDLTCSSDANSIISEADIATYHVVYDEARLEYKSSSYILNSSYALVPERLESFTTLSVEPNSSKRVWLKVQVPDKDANLAAGLYEGNVVIERIGEPNVTVPIDFTVYNIELGNLDHINVIYSDPYAKVYSTDVNVVYNAYSETGAKHFASSGTHRIITYEDPCKPYGIGFDSNNFEMALDNSMDGGVIKNGDKVLMYISSWTYLYGTNPIYSITMGSTYNSSDLNLWANLSDANFVGGFKELLGEYDRIASDPNRNIEFMYQVQDEPGKDPYKRILSDRLYTIIQDSNLMTGCTYYTGCDDEIDPGSYNTPNDINIPPLTSLVDYKIWHPSYIDSGYANHQDPNYHGHFGYYTTGHSHWHDPTYNRFLHGLFAFRTDSEVISAYAMGDYMGDPYNDFDAHYNHIFPFTYPDFLYAYPTWSGELLYTIGGLEGIREGIKDAKYIATLQNILDDPNTNWGDQNVIDANNYLVSLKADIDPNFSAAYSSQATEFGYYNAILADINDSGDPNDFEAFNRIRKEIADYIVAIDPNS